MLILEGEQYQLYHSNTTLVKVKLCIVFFGYVIAGNSNTTLVKVKFYKKYLYKKLLLIQIQHLLKLNIQADSCCLEDGTIQIQHLLKLNQNQRY